MGILLKSEKQIILTKSREEIIKMSGKPPALFFQRLANAFSEEMKIVDRLEEIVERGNMNYENICCVCGAHFKGYRHALHCRDCVKNINDELEKVKDERDRFKKGLRSVFDICDSEEVQKIADAALVGEETKDNDGGEADGSAASPDEKKNWPKTVKEAVAIIISRLRKKDKSLLRKTKKDDLVQFHFTWGMALRNEFGLWEGNKELLRDTGHEHPDDASGVIIDAVWAAIQEEK